MNDDEGHSRSPEMAIFDMSHITSYLWSVIATFRIYYLFNSTLDLTKFFSFDMTVKITGNMP